MTTINIKCTLHDKLKNKLGNVSSVYAYFVPVIGNIFDGVSLYPETIVIGDIDIVNGEIDENIVVPNNLEIGSGILVLSKLGNSRETDVYFAGRVEVEDVV